MVGVAAGLMLVAPALAHRTPWRASKTEAELVVLSTSYALSSAGAIPPPADVKCYGPSGRRYAHIRCDLVMLDTSTLRFVIHFLGRAKFSAVTAKIPETPKPAKPDPAPSSGAGGRDPQ